MAYDYEELYKSTPDALGAPSKVLVDWFGNHVGAKLSVLDVGCGQGRDALFIARAGHHVTAVDISPSGIASLNKVSKQEGLDITGVVADITTYTPQTKFDVALCDRTLHMLPEELRLSCLTRLSAAVHDKGWVLIFDEKSNIPAMLWALQNMSSRWRVDHAKNGLLFVQLV